MENIRIEINDRRKIFAIREMFTNAFPNLKLEFYAKPHSGEGAHSDKIVTNNRLTIADCRTVDNNGFLEINPEMTTSELKNHLLDVFGLKVEICKWDGFSWKAADSGKQSLSVFNKQNGFAL